MNKQALFISSFSGSLSDNGSKTKIQISPTIVFPRGSEVYFELLEATIPYTNPNISPELNNNVFSYNLDGIHSYTIATGNYSISGLNETILEKIRNDTISGILPEDLFILAIDPSTNRISLQINSAGVSIPFSTTSTIGAFLGFVDDIPLTTSSGLWFESTQKALVDNTLNYAIHADFSDGMYFRSRKSDVIGIVPTSKTQPGTFIYYQPYHPSVTRVISNTIDEIVIYLTDQDNKPVQVLDNEFTLLGNFVIYNSNDA